MIDRDFIRRMRAKYGAPTRAPVPSLVDPDESALDRFQTLRPGRDGSAAELLDRFLADASIPLAVLHSRALGRDYILARDSRALHALTEADQALPVLTFADCEQLAGLSAADIGPVLDVKLALGPEIELREVRPARSLQ